MIFVRVIELMPIPLASSLLLAKRVICNSAIISRTLTLQAASIRSRNVFIIASILRVLFTVFYTDLHLSYYFCRIYLTSGIICGIVVLLNERKG